MKYAVAIIGPSKSLGKDLILERLGLDNGKFPEYDFYNLEDASDAIDNFERIRSKEVSRNNFNRASYKDLTHVKMKKFVKKRY